MATTISTNQSGTINTVNLTNWGTGYTSQPMVSLSALAVSSMYSQPPTALTITNDKNETVLSISRQGEIEFNGPPSKAADKFLKSFGSHLDNVVVGKLAQARTYRRAIEKCLNNARNMTKEEYIALLEEELQARNSKAVLEALKDDNYE